MTTSRPVVHKPSVAGQAASSGLITEPLTTEMSPDNDFRTMEKQTVEACKVSPSAEKYRTVGVGTHNATLTVGKNSPITQNEKVSHTTLESTLVQTDDGHAVSVPPTEQSGTPPEVERYPTSKLGKPLPSSEGEVNIVSAPPGKPPVQRGTCTSAGTMTESDNIPMENINEVTNTSLSDFTQMLNWSKTCHSPELKAYVAKITCNRSERNKFLQIDKNLSVPSKVKDSWYIPVHIGGNCYHLLCDTGSAATIISPKIYKSAPTVAKTPLVAPGVKLRSASEDHLSVSGLCCLEMELGNKKFPCRVLVADIEYDGIIGTNFLEHYKCVIDVSEGLLRLPHGKIFMAKDKKPMVCRVTTSNDVIVPAHTQLVLTCRVKSHCNMTTPVSVVESARKIVSRYGVLVGRCLVNTGPHIPVLLLNPGSTPVQVAAGTSIALLKSISYLDDLSVDELFGGNEGSNLSNSWTGDQSMPFTVNCGRASSEAARTVRLSTPHSNNLLDSDLTADRAAAPVDESSVPVHSSVNSMVPDGSLTCVRSTDRGTSWSHMLVRENSLPVHSSVNSMEESGNSSVSGYASSWEEKESRTVPTATESLSHQRVTSWYCAPEHSNESPLDLSLTADVITLAENDMESGDELHNTVEYFDTHDAMGEPRISVVLPAGKDNHYFPQDECSTIQPFLEPVNKATYDLVRSEIDSDSSEDLVSSQKSGESSESEYSISDYSDQDGEIPACRVNLIEKWARSSEPPVYLNEHLMGLINRDLPKEQQFELAKTLVNYQDIFVGPDGKLGRTDIIKHDIHTTSEQPIKHAPRRMSPQQNEVISRETQKMLSAGVIQPSDSPWASPVVLVRKKDGSVRFCIDYRKLNNITSKDAYPLPNIEDAVNTLCGAQYFCTLDLASGYWQVELTEDAKRKSAFVTREGLFEFNVMPFGLSNAPATFERLMELVLRGMTWRQCVVYIDDVIVFGTTFEETHNRLINVFDRLRQAHLKLKPKKCFLFKDSTLYLGYQVSSRGVEPDPAKI